MKAMTYATIFAVIWLLSGITYFYFDNNKRHETAMLEPVPELSSFWESYETSGLIK